MAPTPLYFTATLSQALEYNQCCHGIETQQTPYGVLQCHQNFTTVPEFLEYLAEEFPSRLAIGSASLDAGVRGSTFAELRDLSAKAATWFKQRLPSESSQESTIGLLASSSPAFVVSWLALMRAGYQVLLLAPYNSATIIQTLLQLSNAIGVCYDERNASLAISAATDTLTSVQIPWTNLFEVEEAVLSLEPTSYSKPEGVSGLTTAYYFHSSGTTGLPKLIPQTHHGAVGVLPLLQKSWADGVKISSTLSVTPLYHGGIADLFRSWSAAAPLWVFSEHSAPITGKSVLTCVSNIFEEISNTHLAYLSCVPFVLEAITQESAALDTLRRFERVGTGGAALPKALGDRLVSAGVKLVSRFGSSECGFLLSSERNHLADGGWNVLREPAQSCLFQPSDDGYNELVVLASWPVVSTAKHAARPMQTKDLFKRCDSGWTYIGRADSQLALATGKKFDPQIFEDALRQIEGVEEALVVGHGKNRPGVLVFRSNLDNKTPQEHESHIWEAIESVNSRSPPHGRIKRSMILMLPSAETARLKRNSKGAIIASHAIQALSEEISSLYKTRATIDGTSSREMIQDRVSQIVRDELAVGDSDAMQRSFFDYGLDSTSCMSIRDQLQQALSMGNVPFEIPFSKIYELDSIDLLVDWIELLLNGKAESQPKERKENPQAQIEALIGRYASFPRPKPLSSKQPQPTSTGTVVLLTGATGFLGAHILAQLLQSQSVRKIYALVRWSRKNVSGSRNAVELRVIDSLIRYGLHDSSYDERLVVYRSDFEDSNLGLTVEQYAELSQNTTHLIHAAWDVNFSLPLKAFEPQIAALSHLYTLLENAGATKASGRFIFCSSTAANVYSSADSSSEVVKIPETAYGQSKMVAERVLEARATIETTIFRIGQLCGDSQSGIWNRTEAWPLMVDASCGVVRRFYDGDAASVPDAIFPDLARSNIPAIDWLPVDIAAQNILAYIFSPQTHRVEKKLVAGTSSINWGVFQETVKQQMDQEFRRHALFIPADEWLSKLANGAHHPAQSLVTLWRKNWAVNSRLAETHSNNIHCSQAVPFVEGQLSDQGSKWWLSRTITWLLTQSTSSSSIQC